MIECDCCGESLPKNKCHFCGSPIEICIGDTHVCTDGECILNVFSLIGIDWDYTNIEEEE